MKQILSFSAFLAALFLLGCEEKPIVIPDLKAGERRVLVEELTGVRCQNCPDGARELLALQTTFGKENLIIVSVHAAGAFSVPYTSNPPNLYDFRFEKATELANFIGIAEGYPTASVNRQLLPGNMSLFSPRSAWPSLAAEEFNEDFQLDMFMNTTYDESSRQLDISLNLAPAATLPGENRITVMITQDSIVDVQLDGQDRIANYIHRHVLRHIVTKADGDIIAEPLRTGDLVKKTFSLTLQPTWDPKQCSVIAFVHHGGNPDKEVLQVVEKHLQE